MAWSYRKRIKIIPGVYLNVSKKGISTSIGVRGASVTFGQNGTYLNTGIPGTGLSHRQKISSPSVPISEDTQSQNSEFVPDNIFSAEVHQVTSQDMQGIREAITAAHKQRKELRIDLARIRMSLIISQVKLVTLYIFLVGFFVESLTQIVKKECYDKKAAIQALLLQIENSRVKLELVFDDSIGILYNQVVKSFKSLAYSQKIWDVTGAYANDRVATRSAASTSIKITPVQFGIRALEDVTSTYDPLWMKNANGADFYFYPGFIVMFSDRKNFGLIGMNELKFKHESVRYIETSAVPHDAKIIDRTWAKVNKNGTPDKRFKGNYQIPIVRYGAILLMTDTGVHEEYMFSNYEASESFAFAFTEYQKVIRSLRPIPIVD
jgi:Protein of unknown function (DUF4236)